MGIQYGRVLLRGLRAGLIINLFEFVFSTYLFAQCWAEEMRSRQDGRIHDPPDRRVPHLGFRSRNRCRLALRCHSPRFGAGPEAAVVAGFAVWLLGYFVSIIPPVALELFPAPLMAAGAAVGLVEIVTGTIAGGWVYREPAAAQPQTQSATAG